MFCPYCGTPLDDDALTCNACNSPVEPLEKSAAPEAVIAPELITEQDPEAQVPVSAAPKKRSPLPRILLTGFGIAVALAAVVALAIYLLPILAGKGPATALYIKDNELYTTRLSKLQPWQVTDKLVDASNADLGSLNKNIYAESLSDYTYLTKDGRTLFYPDGYTPGDNGVTIYYRNIKNPEEAPQKLDSNIYQYTVSPDGSRVVYLKSDGTLFRYNMQEKTKVATDITADYQIPHFYTSEDCKNLIYMVANENGTFSVYAQAEGGERVKLASDCSNIQYINNACNTLYYTNSKYTLYKVTTDQEKEKIAYDVSKVFCIYESGEIYYATNDPSDPSTPVTADQLVEDDMKNDTSRDALRQALARTDICAQYASTLCYYDGKESHMLAENCVFNVQLQNPLPIPYALAADTPTLIYSYCDMNNVKKVKLSQVTNMDELTKKIEENTASANKVFVAVKNTVTQMQPEHSINANTIRVTDDGKTAYYLVKKADARMGELYKFSIADGKPQKTALYASDVYRFTVLDNSTILYYCDYAENKATADLYMNQALVDYDVEVDAHFYDSHSKRLYYFTDMDKNHTNGTLKLWEDHEAIKIADQVHTFEWFDDEVLYITDYNENKGHGTLYLFQNDESYQVDTEVSHIIGSDDDFGFVFRKIMRKY